MRGAEYWVRILGLAKHPEGGYFSETYRSAETVAAGHLPARFGGDRCFSTAIYYLLAGDDFSSLHRIASDETWHFYRGSPLAIHCLGADTGYRKIILGDDPGRGQSLQATVPAGAWFGAEVNDKNSFSLVGCTVAPGFDFADFEEGKSDELSLMFPEHAGLIRRLTRK
ncbi:MAG TPA: cupin domain-containing protein [Spirochaetota bacterium]|nr:cupin domain-containing protein [Spirochaetota bacterium]HRZ27844.1 cupin domain-containing protein [Spirochaetota bacterium]HSA15678.1 cupin domain-containing protein [Spirochaetota bacterium]